MKKSFRICSLGVAVLAIWATPAQAGCEKDTDCKGERICVESACADPAAAPPSPPPTEAAPAAAADVPTEAAPAEGEAAPAEGEAAPAEGEAAPAEGEAAPAEGEAAPAEGEADAAAGSGADDWWTMDARETEAALLQELFNELPKPVRTKGAGKLVYQRSVPLVIADIHDTTAVWGSKLQKDVHFLGISKVHTTQSLDSIGPETAGIPYCPLACNRISQVFVTEEEITLQYDGPIKDWAGKASDNVAGYTRRFGKIHQAKCSFPLMVKHAPPNTWMDPEEVSKVRAAVVDEIKRYCAE